MHGDAGVKLHEQVSRTLRDEILGGGYAGDGLLPPDAVLGARFGVSRMTIRTALDDLVAGGLISRRQGRRTRVVAEEPLVTRDVESEVANTLAVGRGTVAQILSFDWARPGREVARRLETGPGERVLRVTRIRRRGGQPVLHTLAYLPERVGAGIARADLEHGQMLDLLAHRGVVFGCAEQEIGAAPCPPPLAGPLQLAAGAPVLRMLRLLRDTQGRPVQLLTATFRWDKFSYRVELTAGDPAAPATWWSHDPPRSR